MLKRYSYRAYPNPAQIEFFARTFGCARVVYNNYVHTLSNSGKIISYNEASRALTALKKQKEYAWLNDVSSAALQQSLKDAALSARNHIRDPKHFNSPKYKKLSGRQSFRIVGEHSFKVSVLNKKWGAVALPKIGVLKYRIDRSLPTKPSSVTVIKEPSGQYKVSFVVSVEPRLLKTSHTKIAMDLGLKSYITTINSDNVVEKVENPRFYRKQEEKLSQLQSLKDHKQKGSKRQEKARLKTAKLYAHVKNQRKDFIDKLVWTAIRDNQIIVTEGLRVNNMLRNKKLSKSIIDAGWGLFLRSISSKCEETGRTHIMADPYYPSSKTCSCCGAVKDQLALSEREWQCTSCGSNLDRDTNACLNLLKLSLAGGSPESLNAHEIKSVRTNVDGKVLVLSSAQTLV